MNQKTIIKKLNEHEENSSACFLLSKKLIEIDPESSRGWYEQGVSLTTFHRFEEAKKAFDKALEYVSEERISYIQHAIGHFYEETGDLKKALEFHNKGLENSEDKFSSFVYIGTTLFRLGKFEEAKTWYGKAIACKEGSIEEAHFNLAGVFRSQEKLESAKEHYLKAIEIDADYEEAEIGLEEVDDALKIKDLLN